MNPRKNQGITMVSLVITIIVMLILAGVAISNALGGNGIINQAGNVRTRGEKAELEEELRIKLLGFMMNSEEDVSGGGDITLKAFCEYLESDFATVYEIAAEGTGFRIDRADRADSTVLRYKMKISANDTLTLEE